MFYDFKMKVAWFHSKHFSPEENGFLLHPLPFLYLLYVYELHYPFHLISTLSLSLFGCPLFSLSLSLFICKLVELVKCPRPLVHTYTSILSWLWSHKVMGHNIIVAGFSKLKIYCDTFQWMTLDKTPVVRETHAILRLRQRRVDMP